MDKFWKNPILIYVVVGYMLLVCGVLVYLVKFSGLYPP